MPSYLVKLLEIFEEACIDTFKLIPILFGVYVIVSYVEHNSHKFIKIFNKAEKFGPVVGASLGIIPQCGFSVVMADLYNKKNITLGTLIAVFIATSDEALPILFSNYDFIIPMFALIVIKFLYAILCGIIIDLIIQIVKKKKQKNNFSLPHQHDACECGHEEHNHEHTNHCCADNIFIHAIKHTLKISLFILAINLVMGILIEYLGFTLSSINNINKFAQPFVTCLIGLIPNCFASVLLVEIYMAGGMAFGSLLAGLCTGAGVGLIVLFKGNKKSIPIKILIMVTLYLIGIFAGIFTNLIGVLIL